MIRRRSCALARETHLPFSLLQAIVEARFDTEETDGVRFSRQTRSPMHRLRVLVRYRCSIVLFQVYCLKILAFSNKATSPMHIGRVNAHRATATLHASFPVLRRMLPPSAAAWMSIPQTTG